MNELSLQKEILDVVKANGGAGRKLNNRFLVGVADLLVKHPDWNAVLLECKFKRVGMYADEVKVPLTTPQHRFLDEFESAGMRTGVVSFVVHPNRWFGVAIVHHHRGTVIKVDEYRWVKLHDKVGRQREMLREFESFMDGG